MKKFEITWPILKEWVISFLRDKAVKSALKKILGNAMAGGFKGWLVKYVVTELYDEVAKPIIQLSFRTIGYYYEVKKGEHVLRKIKDAETNDEWRDSVNDA